MARALSHGKALFAVLTSDGITGIASSRSISSAAAVGKGLITEEKEVIMKGKMKGMEALAAEPPGRTDWVPDPVTGYYRPANILRDMDPAELRKMFLKHGS